MAQEEPRLPSPVINVMSTQPYLPDCIPQTCLRARASVITKMLPLLTLASLLPGVFAALQASSILDSYGSAVSAYTDGKGPEAARLFEAFLSDQAEILTDEEARDVQAARAFALASSHLHLLRLERAGVHGTRKLSPGVRLKETLNHATELVDIANDQAAENKIKPGREEADQLISEVYAEYGHAEMTRRNFNQAVERFRVAIKLAPNEADIRASLGQALFASGHYPEASQQLLRAAAAILNNTVTRLRRGAVAQRRELISDVYIAFKNAASAQTKFESHPYRWTAAGEALENALLAPLLPPRKKKRNLRLDASAMRQLSTPGAAVQSGLEQKDYDTGALLLRKVSIEAANWRWREWLERELARIVHNAWVHRNTSLLSSLSFETLMLHPGAAPKIHNIQGSAAFAYCEQTRVEAKTRYSSYLHPDQNPSSQRWKACSEKNTASRRSDCIIRVAYLSADWRDHPCGRILGNLLENHHRRSASTFDSSRAPLIRASALAINPVPTNKNNGHARARAETITRLRREAVSAGTDASIAFVDVSSAEGQRSDASKNTLDALRDLNADILVDVMGFTSGHLAPIAGMRTAPIKVLFIGFAGAMGLCADYAITDRITLPPDIALRTYGSQRNGGARIIYLPKAMWYLPTSFASSPATSHLAVADADGNYIDGDEREHDTLESLGLKAEIRTPTRLRRERAIDRISRGFSDLEIYDQDERTMHSEVSDIASDAFGASETFVFCAYNALHKTHTVPFHVSMAVLRRVPKSVLHVPREPLEAYLNLRAEAAASGIDPLRILGLPWLDGDQRRHLAAKRHCNLFLDNPSYSAHATAADALWAGVPIMSLPGETWAGRVSFGALHALFHGQDEKEAFEARELLMPSSYRNFEDNAVRIANEPELYARVRRAVARSRGSPNNKARPVHAMFGTWKHEISISQAFMMLVELKEVGRNRYTIIVGDGKSFSMRENSTAHHEEL